MARAKTIMWMAHHGGSVKHWWASSGQSEDWMPRFVYTPCGLVTVASALSKSNKRKCKRCASAQTARDEK